MIMERETKHIPEDELRSKEAAEVKPNNVVELSTENADYDIVYNIHLWEIPESKVLLSSDLIMLELPRVDKEVAQEQLERPDKGYVKIVEHAFKHEKPLFFIDVSKQSDVMRRFGESILLRSFEAYFGVKLLLSRNKPLWKPGESTHSRLSRRKFLTKTAKTLAGIYLTSPILKTIVDLPSVLNLGHPKEGSLLRKTERAVYKAERALHPELKTMHLEGRNALMAQKAETISKTVWQKTGRRPRVALVIGGGHIGIEDSLRSTPDERLKEIKKYFSGRLDDEAQIIQVNPQIDEQGNRTGEVIVYQDETIAAAENE